MPVGAAGRCSRSSASAVGAVTVEDRDWSAVELLAEALSASGFWVHLEIARKAAQVPCRAPNHRCNSCSSDTMSDSLKHDAQTHFEFGKNWARYGKTITQEDIDISKANLEQFLSLEDLSGKTFLGYRLRLRDPCAGGSRNGCRLGSWDRHRRKLGRNGTGRHFSALE